ncbi:unnamed protein product [Victoria cruziana]
MPHGHVFFKFDINFILVVPHDRKFLCINETAKGLSTPFADKNRIIRSPTLYLKGDVRYRAYFKIIKSAVDGFHDAMASLMRSSSFSYDSSRGAELELLVEGG